MKQPLTGGTNVRTVASQTWALSQCRCVTGYENHHTGQTRQTGAVIASVNPPDVLLSACHAIRKDFRK